MIRRSKGVARRRLRHVNYLMHVARQSQNPPPDYWKPLLEGSRGPQPGITPQERVELPLMDMYGRLRATDNSPAYASTKDGDNRAYKAAKDLGINLAKQVNSESMPDQAALNRQLLAISGQKPQEALAIGTGGGKEVIILPELRLTSSCLVVSGDGSK